MELHLHACAACAIRLVSSNILLRQFAESTSTEAGGETAEKRRELRVVTTGAGVVQRINPFSRDPIDVRILDVSRNGLRIGSPHFFEPGTTVKVRFAQSIAFGQVRHCRMIGGAYQTGIEVEKVFEVDGYSTHKNVPSP